MSTDLKERINEYYVISYLKEFCKKCNERCRLFILNQEPLTKHRIMYKVRCGKCEEVYTMTKELK